MIVTRKMMNLLLIISDEVVHSDLSCIIAVTFYVQL